MAESTLTQSQIYIFFLSSRPTLTQSYSGTLNKRQRKHILLVKEIISIEAAETKSGWHQVTYLVVGEAMPAQDMPMTWCHFDSSTPLFPRKIVTDSIQQWISFASSSCLVEWLHSLKVSPLQHIDLSSESCAACEASSCHLRCLHCERGTARPSRSIMGGEGRKKLTNW